MKLLTIICCLATICCHAQNKRFISTYAVLQQTNTSTDYTIRNNPWGLGVGLQAVIGSKWKLAPIVSATTHVYLYNDKVLRLNTDGSIKESVETLTNLFVGMRYNVVNMLHISISSGASLVNKEPRLGIQGEFGCYFTAKQNWLAKFGYLHMNRKNYTEVNPFNTITVSLSAKLF